MKSYAPVLLEAVSCCSTPHATAFTMSWAVSIFFSLVLVLAGLVGWIVYARCFHPLAKFPGPLVASVTRLWLICDVATGAAEKTQARLHKRYGMTPGSEERGRS